MIQYVKEALNDELASGRLVVIETPGPFFAILNERYPMGLNRISWDKVPGHHRIEVRSEQTEIESDEIEARLAQCRATVQRWLDEVYFVLSLNVIWLGDMTDVGLEVSGDALLDVFPTLCSFPQHSYIFPKDGSWCLNYVMEGELFFGRAPLVAASGAADSGSPPELQRRERLP